MARKRKRRTEKYQVGGMLGGLLGGAFGGGGGNLLGDISKSLQQFSNEPALQGILGQSNSMFDKFKQDASASGSNINTDQFKGLFDLASLFGSGGSSGGLFQDGGMVTKRGKAKVTNELSRRFGAINDTIIETEYQNNMDEVIDGFNQAYGENQTPPSNIIPGMNKRPSVTGKGEKLQRGGIPTSPRGQFDFPGQPVNVPTPSGQITMDGVDRYLLAIDQQGNQQVLSPNSGMHQFAPGNVLEIPIDEDGDEDNDKKEDDDEEEDDAPKRSKRKAKRLRQKKALKNMDSVKGLPRGKKDPKLSTRIPNASVRKFNKRNRRTMAQNKLGNVGLPNTK